MLGCYGCCVPLSDLGTEAVSCKPMLPEVLLRTAIRNWRRRKSLRMRFERVYELGYATKQPFVKGPPQNGLLSAAAPRNSRACSQFAQTPVQPVHPELSSGVRVHDI